MYYNIDDKNVLKNIIDRYDAISFDVWDTLITRAVLLPENIFSIINIRAEKKGIHIPDFPQQRQEAVFRVECANPNIVEIYDAVQKVTGISDVEKDILIQIEIQTESELIIPRKEMIEVLNYALDSGKKISLITDMYLPQKVMEGFLNQVNIKRYDHIFVSCDYRQLKIENLFSIYKEKVHAESYLHIGDNNDSDIVAAQRWGIDAALVKKGYDLLKGSTFADLIEKAKTHNERCLAGLFCAYLFNSPFAKSDKVKINDCKDLGSIFIAPIISEFMHWLGNEMKKGCFEGILFAARDGYLLNKLYSQMQRYLSGLPRGIYFLTSRELCTQAGIEDDKDILWLSSVKFCGSERELLQFRFCLEDKDILPLEENEVKDLTQYVMLHKNRIHKKAWENRQNYLAFIEREGIKAEKEYAFFDFVSSGTCQYYLKRFLPFKLKGKYFCRSVTNDEKSYLEIDALYLNDGVTNADSLLYENYRCLETIMTSPMPSLLYIDKNLDAIYDEEVRSEEELKFVVDIQEAVEEYFQYFCLLCDWNEKTSMEMAERIYLYMKKEGVEIICKTLDSMQLRDDWVREFVEK